MADFLMPSLGADMEAGTLISWHVRPGDVVSRGDVVATIETDKAAIDVEVWESGTIGALLVAAGARVPVGAPLATIIPAGAPTGTVPPPPAAGPPASAAPAATDEAPQVVARATPDRPATRAPGTPAPDARRHVDAARPRVSPLARAAASRLGVDLGAVRGTGMNRAVTEADVLRAANEQIPGATAHVEPAKADAARSPQVGGSTSDRAASLRRATAAAMSRSHREIPHYYLGTPVDLTTAVEWLERTNRERSVRERLIPAALFIRAVALATRAVPELNGHWLDGDLRPADRTNVGFAVAIPGGGLLAPALLDADRKSLTEVMGELRALVARARAGSLRSSEINEGSITVTSLGERGGADAVYGLINPPQVALVGFGNIAERPWAEGGALSARRQVHVSLSADHRASDGHRGSLFLATLNQALQHPERL